MIKAGLVSVTFRNLKPKEIVKMAKKASFSAIEWCGDVHVPHGNAELAKEAKEMTLGEGLEVSSYGSYYRAGLRNVTDNPAFKDVLKSAVMLNAPVIRVWAGSTGSKNAGKDYWDSVIADSRKIADEAAKEGIRIAYEYHQGTLTDEIYSARRLMEEINQPNCSIYWQPFCGMDESKNLEGLELILPWLENIHVFHWKENNQRRPLSEGYDTWKKYLNKISKVVGDRYVLLEFVKDNNTEQLIRDAETLNNLIKALE